MTKATCLFVIVIQVRFASKGEEPFWTLLPRSGAHHRGVRGIPDFLRGVSRRALGSTSLALSECTTPFMPSSSPQIMDSLRVCGIFFFFFGEDLFFLEKHIPHSNYINSLNACPSSPCRSEKEQIS